MTSKDLKNALLQEAVQGKLVPQIASEGNARDLLNEIRKEKSKLIKEGKLKKEKPLPELTEEEIPFDIPENWCWCRLGEIGDWKAGSTPSRSNPELYNGTIPWLKTGDLTDGYINEIPEFISEKALGSCSMRLNPIGSVLIAMYGATIGKLGILNIEAATNQACCACVSYNGIDNKYLFYYLMSQKKSFTEKAEGGAQPNISREKLVVHLFPLPPLAEQKRIVAAIEQFIPLIKEYGKKEAELTALNADIAKTLKNAILQEAVQGKLAPQIAAEGNAKDLLEEIKKEKAKLVKEGKLKKEKPLPEITEEEIPFDIPESWCWCKLGELGITNTGTTPSKSEGKYFGNYIDFLSPADIDGSIVTYGNQGLSEEGYKVARPTPKGTIIQVCIGGSIGKCAIVDREVTFNQQINSISPIRLNSDYIYYTISSDFFYKNIRESATGTATPIINKSNWERLLIPLPPLAEQKRIVTAIKKMLPLCEKLGE